MLLDYAGTLTIGATIALLVVGVASTALTRLEHKLTLAGVAGAWVGLAVTVVAHNGLSIVWVLPALFLLPFVTVATLSAAVPAFREAVLRIPVPLIVALNVPRVLGVTFLFLAAAGRLAGPFPYSAGIGDIITGLFALSVARIAARQSANRLRVLLWNAFGTLDLIVAVALGVTSQPGSPLQLIHWGVGSAAITTLPYALIPVFLVPFYLVGHGIVFIQARRQAPAEQRGLEATSHPGAAVAPI